MLKLLHFSGPCSFATFLGNVGDSCLVAVRFVRCFEDAGVVCGVSMDALDEHHRDAVMHAIQMAHSIEPVKIHHDIRMSDTAVDLLVTHLSS